MRWGRTPIRLTPDRAAWRTYRALLDHLARQFDSGALAPPPVIVLGHLSLEVVRQAHALLERHAVQGKLVMTC